MSDDAACDDRGHRGGAEEAHHRSGEPRSLRRERSGERVGSRRRGTGNKKTGDQRKVAAREATMKTRWKDDDST